MISRPPIPVTTLILIGANILAAYGLLFAPEWENALSFFPDHPTLVGTLGSMFLHANVVHLLGNMVFLAAVGAAVEIATGWKRYLTVYLVSGLVGVALHYAVSRNAINPAPYQGASGAIAGCVAYYTVRYTTLRVSIAPNLSAPLLAVTGLWIALQLIGAFVKIGDTGGTSYWSHLGGVLAGITLSFVFKSPDTGQQQLGHEVLDQLSSRGPAAVIAGAEQHLQSHPSDLDAWRKLEVATGQTGDVDRQGTALLRIIELQDVPDIAALSRLCAIGKAHLLSAPKRMITADQIKLKDVAVARDLIKSVIKEANASTRPDALLALAAINWNLNPDLAAPTLAILKQDYPLDPATDLARKRGWIV